MDHRLPTNGVFINYHVTYFPVIYYKNFIFDMDIKVENFKRK
jgi:hypothetical protein